MNRYAKLLSAFTLVLASIGASFASEFVASADVVSVPTVIGAGVAITPDYLGSDDKKVVPMPFGKYTFENSHRYLKLSGLQVDLNVLNMPNFYAGPVMNVRGSRDDNVKDQVVKKMVEVESGLELGAFIAYDFRGDNPRNKLGANLKVLADASGDYKGFNVDLDVNLWRQLAAKVDFFFGGGATYTDEKYMDTFFGVNSANRGTATALELPDYTAGGGARDVRAQTGLLWYYDRTWIIGGVVRYQRLLGDAKDSPIVALRGSPNQPVAAVFVSYLWN